MLKTATSSLLVVVLMGLVPLEFTTGQAKETKDPTRPGKPRTLHLPAVLDRYANIDLPAHFTTRQVRNFDNTPRDNPVTDAGATLGRVLFYDTRLSVNNTIACASCHQQKHAFADPRRFSKGFNGKEGDRNAMSLVNARFYSRGKFFWDERAGSLEEQVLHPIQNKIEMGQTLPAVVRMVGADPAYARLFQKAFGKEEITQEHIARALAQFIRSMVSYQSKYDEGLAKASSVRADFPNFTDQENRGKSLFLRQCAVCHLPPGQAAVFYMRVPANNGLDADLQAADAGVADITLNRFHTGQFKSPSLRNVEFTAPYMHDGRFSTLEKVIDHYSTGVKLHPNLDPRSARAARSVAPGRSAKGRPGGLPQDVERPHVHQGPKVLGPVSVKRLRMRRAAQGLVAFFPSKGKGMKSWTAWLAPLAAGTLFLVWAVTAQPPPGRRPPGPPPGPGGLERIIDDLGLSKKDKEKADKVLEAHHEEVRKQWEKGNEELLKELKGVLSARQLARLKEDLMRRPPAPPRGPVCRAALAFPRRPWSSA